MAVLGTTTESADLDSEGRAFVRVSSFPFHSDAGKLDSLEESSTVLKSSAGCLVGSPATMDLTDGFTRGANPPILATKLHPNKVLSKESPLSRPLDLGWPVATI